MLTKENWLQVAKEYSTKGPTNLSKELGVSRQRIEQLASLMRQNGIAIPKIPKKRQTKEFLSFVKSNFSE